MAKSKVTLFVDGELLEGLRLLSSYTRINKSEYIREGIRLVLDKYRHELARVDIRSLPLKEVVATISRLVDEGRREEAIKLHGVVVGEIKGVERFIEKKSGDS